MPTVVLDCVVVHKVHPPRDQLESALTELQVDGCEKLQEEEHYEMRERVRADR